MNIEQNYTMKTTFLRIAYALLPSQLMDPSCFELDVIMVQEGVQGYYSTDWKWSRDNAELCRDAKNAGLGLTPAEAEQFLVASMFPRPSEG